MSRYTRIILINDEEQGMREFTISHRMVWLLSVLGVLLAGLLLWVLITFGTVSRQAQSVPALKEALVAAQAETAQLEALRAELETMRGLQERLLLMLGIETTSGARDTTQDDMQRLASAVMTPPPDAWPAAGFVTQEYIEGSPARGIRPHHGLDVAGPEGAPILAAGDGVVARVDDDPYLGNFVEIQHGLGYLTVYGHCLRAAVERGEQVRRGQVVAYMGSSGEASASHLHFEIWHNGMAVDPRQFLEGEPPQP